MGDILIALRRTASLETQSPFRAVFFKGRVGAEDHLFRIFPGELLSKADLQNLHIWHLHFNEHPSDS